VKRFVITAPRAGLIMLVATLAITMLLFNKDRIGATLMSGETITIQFDRAYKLRPYLSEVKVAYVPVGKVISVHRNDDGTADVEVKVESDVLERLGDEPSATIRPTTLLGGIYFVDLAPGGDPGEFTAGSTIPVERTDVPVELDRVARALQPDELQGLQSSVARIDKFLDRGGSEALDELLVNAPGTLEPAAVVLDAAQGDGRADSLAQVVRGLENTSTALTRDEGRIDSIIASARQTSRTVARRSPEIADTVANLPSALRSTRVGLGALDGALAALEDVAEPARDTAQSLDRTLADIGPVLREARPVVADLRTVLADARPLVSDLVPISTGTREVLVDVRGPVLDRLSDKVVPFLSEKYDGKGPYAETSSDQPMYMEAALALANVDRATAMSDRNGNAISFHVSAGTGTIGGIPINIEQLTRVIMGWTQLEQPIETLPPLNGPNGDDNLARLVDQLLGNAR
jgi:phospholipid/cholesterol/gamma-HCH transport system substrate-binding protein